VLLSKDGFGGTPLRQKNLNKIITYTRTHPKTSFCYDRLQSPWICVVGKKGPQCASAHFRAFFTPSLDHGLFARSRHKTGFGMSSINDIQNTQRRLKDATLLISTVPGLFVRSNSVGRRGH
jgi:hypothetical protein